MKKPYEYTSMKSLNEQPKRGFWGSLASKAKALLDEDHDQSPPTRMEEEHNNMPSSSTSETKVWF